MFPELSAAAAAAATFDGRHVHREGRAWRECGLCVAHMRGIDACADELLPAVLGGEWMAVEGGTWPPPRTGDNVTNELFDHETVFRRRGARGPRSWRDCAIISEPYN